MCDPVQLSPTVSKVFPVAWLTGNRSAIKQTFYPSRLAKNLIKTLHNHLQAIQGCIACGEDQLLFPWKGQALRIPTKTETVVTINTNFCI